MNAKELNGKVALVTGASKGLGKAMALALGEAGAKLALASRDRKLLAETAAAVRARGAEAEAFPADVSDEAQVLALEKAVSARFGRLHILINNAG
ncbi:MAG: SDR family NAD(P)-dependent oxidoreductase, partial [Planctomycetota bacterium]